MALFKIYRGDSSNLPGGKDGWTAPDGITKLAEHKMHDGYAYFCADTGEFFIDVDLSIDHSALKRVQINALAATKLSDGTTTIEIDDIVLKSDIIDVEHGGTGRSSLTLNAVLIGDGTNKVKLIPATLGAFFVDTTNGAPKFDVLPVGQGGIGANTLESGGILQGNGTNAISTVSGTGVLYAATKGTPQFGVAPISVGGTAATSKQGARNNLEVYSKDEVNAALSDATTVAYTTTLVPSGWTAEGDGFVYTYANADLKCGKDGKTDIAKAVPPLITFSSNREEYNKIDKAIATPGTGIKFYIEKKPTEAISIIIIDQM